MIAAIVERARDDQSSLDKQHAAFGELVHRFEAMAFSVALRTLDDVDEARDATQEAFLTAWLKLRTLRQPAAFGTWLKQLVRTQCSRRIRKRAAAFAERPFVDAADARERRRLIARLDDIVNRVGISGGRPLLFSWADVEGNRRAAAYSDCHCRETALHRAIEAAPLAAAVVAK